MKTHRRNLAAWLAVAAIVVVSAGCGAGSVTTGEAGAASQDDAATNTASAAGTHGVAGAGDQATGGAVKRAERSLPPLRPEIAEVVELIESGAGEEVARTFVSVSSTAYELSLEEIIYLRDIGIPDGVIAAMMRRGGELREQQAEMATLQTNLVTAVGQLKEAMASAAPAGEPASNGASTAGSPAADGTEVLATGEGIAAGTTPVAVQTAAPPSEAPPEVQQFYSDLAPYGSWYQVPTYGWVWQPAVVTVNPVWVPYRHGGRWVWTDCGWYWSSDYSWGWAPFHYGRWCTYPGIGWCWVPGTVWGPSWVTWRSCGNYVGWAPLPPGCGWSAGVGLTWHGSAVSVGFGFGYGAAYYSFVPYHSFCHRNVGHHVIHGTEVNTAYQNSTVINNVINGNNNVIINNGVGYEQIAARTRGEVPKARIEPLPGATDRPVRADRLERGKDGYVIYRPTAVEGVGGRPTALRNEVRPTVTTASSAIRPSALSPSGQAALRTSGPARVAEAGSTPSKPIVERGSRSLSSVSAPASAPSQARPTARSSALGTAPAGRQLQGVTSSKPVESRSAPAGVRSSSPASGSVGTMVGPTRQTTPVPLGDPSRNIPAQMRQPAPRTPATTVAPAKPLNEGRGGVGYSSGAGREVNSRSAPAATMNTRTAPSAVMPSAPSRSFQPNPRTGLEVSRPSVMSVAPPSMPSVPRSVMTAPSPSSSPVMSAPRSTMTAPSPMMNAPRPSFSAPSAPAMSAPRATFSAPAPARSVPSGPRPSGPAAGSGSSRAQPN